MAPSVMVPSEIVPLEEAVEALLNGLVSPFLPRRSNSNAPTPEQHELVSKQMYAVVVLYNYYHRKLFPKLEFLDFKSFCKVSCISKPSLLKYMKAIYQGDVHSGELDENLSNTERMIKYACNVSSALDVSIDAPGIDGWPISKVAVFLLDPSKEYCLLRSNVGTEAIMSIIEKDLVTPLENVFCVPKIKSMLGSKKNESLSLQDKINSVDHMLLETALSTVHDEMGISSSNLRVLECHLSYSMSHIKSCSRLYIMSYTDPIDGQISVKEVIRSLQGPLVKINSSGAPEVTAAIRYYSLLPYLHILSDFLLRESSHSTLQPNYSLKSDCHKQVFDRILVNGSDRGYKKMNICSSKNSTLSETISKNKEKHPVVDLFAFSQSAAISPLTKEVLPIVNGEGKEGGSSPLKQNLDIVISKKRKLASVLDGSSGAAHSKADDSATGHNLKPSIKDEGTNLSNAYSRNSADDVENGLNQVGECMNEMLNCHDTLPLSKTVDLMSVLQKFKKKRDELCQQQRLLEDNISHFEMGILTVISGNHSSASKVESILNTCEFLSSSEMKNDAILSTEAQCHPQTIGRKRLCEAVLRLQNPCQELDEIFCTNNWILPKYYVFPSVDEGKFQALVSVHGMDFESECSGDWKSNPKEARESSAAHMLIKLRNMVIGTQQSA